MLASCSFSFSAGGPDYEKLEAGIADELNGQYAKLSREVSGVDCPKQSEKPKAGDTFLCGADIEGQNVRVEVTVEDDDNSIRFSTLDSVYDLEIAAQGLSRDLSGEFGFDVVVDCGEGLKVVAVGESFECIAADRRGDTRTVKLTAGGAHNDDDWEIVD